MRKREREREREIKRSKRERAGIRSEIEREGIKFLYAKHWNSRGVVLGKVRSSKRFPYFVF